MVDDRGPVTALAAAYCACALGSPPPSALLWRCRHLRHPFPPVLPLSISIRAGTCRTCCPPTTGSRVSPCFAATSTSPVPLDYFSSDLSCNCKGQYLLFSV